MLGRFRDAVLPDFSLPPGSDDYVNSSEGDIVVDMFQGLKLCVQSCKINCA